MARGIRTVLLDRNDLFREGLRRILLATDFRVVKTGSTLDEILSALSGKPFPDLLLLSPGIDYHGAAASAERFKEKYPNARVVVLSDTCNLEGTLLVLAAGADGLILRHTCHDTLTKSLHLVMLGETVLPSEAGRQLAGLRHLDRATYQEAMVAPAAGGSPSDDDASQRLSSREAEILECLTRGEANKVIARKFEITEATVKVHVKAILRKIRVSNRTQAAIWAHSQSARSQRPSVGSIDKGMNGSAAGGKAIRIQVLGR